ncbi:MAG TPA: pentapeptide repeat-containing protein, partial [Blastocatellia bacterium]|nr:pentapeptide repeat-containing protein [Blastocatellia bacterium]
DGASLDGASLDGASFDGARLHGARLDGARLDRARLDRAFGLTWEQIDRAFIDQRTSLPEEFEELRKQKLERQQGDSENDFIELEEDSEADQEDTDAEPNE